MYLVKFFSGCTKPFLMKVRWYKEDNFAHSAKAKWKNLKPCNDASVERILEGE